MDVPEEKKRQKSLPVKVTKCFIYKKVVPKDKYVLTSSCFCSLQSIFCMEMFERVNSKHVRKFKCPLFNEISKMLDEHCRDVQIIMV